MDGATQLVVFSLDEQLYALPVRSVERVLPAAAVTAVPDASDLILGLLNVAGRILPAINMRTRLGVADRAMQLTDRFVVARASQRTVALLTDSVVGVVESDAQDMVAADTVMPGLPYIQAVLRRGEDAILILSDAFSAEEEEALASALERRYVPSGASDGRSAEQAKPALPRAEMDDPRDTRDRSV